MSNELGAKIKRLRKEKGFTLEELGKKVSSGKSYIWELENKGLKKPSAEKLSLIAQALDVTTEFLMNNEQEEVTDLEKKEVYFRKMSNLDKDDQDKIMDLIDLWGKKK